MTNNVTTYHYDNERTGWNRNEVQLTPQVVSTDFGLLFRYDSAVVDDVVHAQPLYLQSVNVAGEIVNAVFIATRSATVYAFDADNWRPDLRPVSPPWLWKTSLVNTANGEKPSGDRPLLATPVIAPPSLRQGVIYVVARFEDGSGNCYFRLHALDVGTGLNVGGLGPVRIDRNLVPTVSGSGDPQNPGSDQVFFDPIMHFNRPALLLANGTVYVAFGSTGDNPPYHGWVLAFRTSDLQLVGSFCTTPDATKDDSAGFNTPTLGGAVWQAGFGIAADNDGRIYCMTGNGLFDAARNYAESLLQLDANVKLTGTFTPPNPEQLTEQDTDFGSGGPMVLPDGAGSGKFIVGCGKDAIVYVVDRATLPGSLNQTGNYVSKLTLAQNASTQPIGGGSGPGVWGGPAYYGGAIGEVIYYCGDHGPLQALAFGNGLLAPALVSPSVPNQTPQEEEFPNEGGSIPVVSSNGSTPATGIVWCVTRPDPDKNNDLRLVAYDAADLTKGNLFKATIGPWNVGGSGTGAFLVPLVVNGKVYVGSDRQLAIYGILPLPRQGNPAKNQLGSPLDGYATGWNSQQHVNYIGADAHVWELVYTDNVGWGHTDLSVRANAVEWLPRPDSPLDGYTTGWNNQQHVNYIGNDGHVHELVYKDNSGWGHTDLSSTTNATWVEWLPRPDSPLDGYATAWNNQQHVNYIGNDGHVHELVYIENSGWRHTNPNLSVSADATQVDWLPRSDSPLDGYATGWNNQQHVNYIGNDSRVHELVYIDHSGWKHTDLCAGFATTQPDWLPRPDSPLDGYATEWNNQQHVNYIGKDNRVHELVYTDNIGWKPTDLSAAGNATQADWLPRPGSPVDGYATAWNNQQHVNYIGNDGHVHELVYEDNIGWKHTDLCAGFATTQPDWLPRPDSPLDGYATGWNNQQHVNYIGNDGHVHELVYIDNSGWEHTDLIQSGREN